MYRSKISKKQVFAGVLEYLRQISFHKIPSSLEMHDKSTSNCCIALFVLTTQSIGSIDETIMPRFRFCMNTQIIAYRGLNIYDLDMHGMLTKSRRNVETWLTRLSHWGTQLLRLYNFNSVPWPSVHRRRISRLNEHKNVKILACNGTDVCSVISDTRIMWHYRNIFSVLTCNIWHYRSIILVLTCNIWRSKSQSRWDGDKQILNGGVTLII